MWAHAKITIFLLPEGLEGGSIPPPLNSHEYLYVEYSTIIFF